MITYDTHFLRHIQYLSPAEQEFVVKALRHIEKLLEGQLRDSGAPSISHPVGIANYLSLHEADATTLVAALLHDTVEDGVCTAEQIESEWGTNVARLVDGVTKLTKIHYIGRGPERQVASLRKLLLAASEDIRVILIKLADRWHNVETITGLRPDKQVRVAQETLDIYVPFARLVGLYNLKNRMEDICFPIAYPEESRLWHAAVTEARSKVQVERTEFVHVIDAKTAHDVTPMLMRATDYEMFRRLQGNTERLVDMQLLDSVVLMVNRDESKCCYEVLGDVHMQYPVRSNLFRDYISNPQPNGYQALHTTIFLTRNHQLLIRVQTKQMFDFAMKRKFSSWISDDHSNFSSVLSSLCSVSTNQKEFLFNLHSNVLAGRINVFTTWGEVVNLPKDASGIDFTFMLNPDHLSYLGGIRVNGEMYDATVVLHEGDTVEPILFDQHSPAVRVQWLEKSKSIEAREALRKELENSPREKQYDVGKTLIEQECRKRALPVWWLFTLGDLQQQLAHDLQEDSFDELVIHVGSGLLLVGHVVDTYKKILIVSPTFLQKVLKFFHLLPRSQTLNKDAKSVSLEIQTEDRPGMIFDLTKCVAMRGMNISSFKAFAIPPRDTLYKFSIEFEHFQDFSSLYDDLLQIPSVKTVLRK